MDSRAKFRISHRLSYILRHHPESVGLSLEDGGWVEVDKLLAALERNRDGPVTREQLVEVVETNDKQRFALSENGSRIRASQGHSVQVDLHLPVAVPPDVLYHGTTERSVASIRADGLQKRRRQHVHLSPDAETARRVGGRRTAAPVVLRVGARAMHEEGLQFFLSANGVWLTDAVPARFIQFPS